LFEFASIPEAVEAIPTHAWLHECPSEEFPPTRHELRNALRRAERRVVELRRLLNPDE